MMKTTLKIIALFFVAVVLSSCLDESYAPKPYAYHRIDLPKPEFENYTDDCPFEFTYSKNAVIKKLNSSEPNDCFLDIYYPQFDGKIHLSYKPILSQNRLNELIKDAYFLTSKHQGKASGITDNVINKPDSKVFGLIYSVTGNAASPIQFVLTDSTKNYIRGALYFNTSPNADSIEPVQAYIVSDLLKMIDSFKWK